MQQFLTTKTSSCTDNFIQPKLCKAFSTYSDISDVLFRTEQSAKNDDRRWLKVVDKLCRHVIDLHSDVETRSETLVLNPCLVTELIKLCSIQLQSPSSRLCNYNRVLIQTQEGVFFSHVMMMMMKMIIFTRCKMNSPHMLPYNN